jgi:methylthioribose-1-phosphate isomerase
MLKAIRWVDRELEIIDQLLLPYVQKYIPVRNAEDGWRVIKEMRVRGAPAIAIVAMLSLASELNTLMVAGELVKKDQTEMTEYIAAKLAYLITSRPTAVNLSEAATRLEGLVRTRAKVTTAGTDVAETFIEAAEKLLIDDVMDNHRLGENGEKWILDNSKIGSEGRKVSILTHCNTG